MYSKRKIRDTILSESVQSTMIQIIKIEIHQGKTWHIIMNALHVLDTCI